MIDAKTLDAMAELLEITSKTKRIKIEFCGENYLVRDEKNKQPVATGDIFTALQCARRYRE